MNILQAIILAILEGLTEFLPVSSTGHMILASSLMKITPTDFSKLYIIAIQLGAILSVVVLYWKRFLGKIDFDFYRKLIIAFIPAVIFGLLLKKQIDRLLESPLVVGIMLLIGGVVFILLDDWFKKSEERGNNAVAKDSTAFKIGLFQVLAMIPGVSRSAATIIGGIANKLNKKAAAEFSFFLAVPTMLGATAKDLWDYHKKGLELTHHDLLLLLIGNAVAFVVAMIAIKAFIDFLTKHGFKLFGYYRIIIGIIVIVLIFLHFGFVETK
jgi:undecaprenyl-diphosphatase